MNSFSNVGGCVELLVFEKTLKIYKWKTSEDTEETYTEFSD